MTVVFGTVEYFEREILINEPKMSKLTKHQFMSIYLRLKAELFDDFVCDERVRIQCMENLDIAYQKLVDLELGVPS